MTDIKDFPTIREESLNALYDKVWSTVGGFLHAAHGGELPKDLDLVNIPETNINYKSAMGDPLHYLRAAFMSVRGGWMIAGAAAAA